MFFCKEIVIAIHLLCDCKMKINFVTMFLIGLQQNYNLLWQSLLREDASCSVLKKETVIIKSLILCFDARNF